MEKIKEILLSHNINTFYLNLDALYEHCGTDLIKFAKMSSDKRSIKSHIMCAPYRYRDDPVINSFFAYIEYKHRPHIIRFDENKYENLSRSVLDLSNRKIFVCALEYFL